MNKDIIGIKLSDGSFYPVFTMGKATEKKLTLTTARDGQTSIRLHLYRSAFGAMEDAEYIDSLRLDGLASHGMNEPTVSFKLSLDEQGNISAELSDSETGASTSKPIQLSAAAAMPDIPDFDFGSDTETDELPDLDFDIPDPQDEASFDVPPLTEEDLDFDLPDSDISSDTSFLSEPADQNPDDDFSMTESPFTDSSLYDNLSPDTKKKEKAGFSIPLAICIICAIICLFVLGIILFINPPKWFSKTTEEAPGYTFDGQLIPDTVDEEASSPNEDTIIVADEPIIPEQPDIVEPDAQEDSSQIMHHVKWGDTLWDLAGSYYKNPWAYPRIAKENNIKNPDLIISGTTLIIPR